MNFRLLIRLFALFLPLFINGLMAVAAPPPQPFCLVSTVRISDDAAALGRQLCEHLDLTRRELAEVKRLVDAGDAVGALAAWRDLKVNQIRGWDMGHFGWHGDQLNGHRLATADLLIGKSPAQAGAKAHTSGNDFFNDHYRLSGSPRETLNANWIYRDPAGSYETEYDSFFFAIPLAARYWQSGNPDYLQKWFQITADFAVHQKYQVLALDQKTQRQLSCNWSVQAGADLAQSARVFSIIRSLGVLVKSLPDGTKSADWEKVNRPVERSAAPDLARLIPAPELAQIALSLVLDHPPALLARYQAVGAVPNQRRSGLASLLFIAKVFPEFRSVPALASQATGGLNDYLQGAFLADGGMLEQSFNYNMGDTASLAEMASWFEETDPTLARQIRDRVKAFQSLLNAVRTPTGLLPAMSSQGAGIVPPLWKSAKIREAWFAKNTTPGHFHDAASVAGEETQASRTAVAKAVIVEQAPRFTSVMLPYSGYYAQRLNWSWDSPYLFMQASRLARGHCNQGHNAIQLTAFGRPLLVSAGPAIYNPEQLQLELRPDFNAVNALFGENSSLKVNTIMVDGNSQSPKTVEQVAPDSPIPSRWLTSDTFDYMEGFYDGGYGRAQCTHLRQVVFVRSEKLWLVADVLKNPDGRPHQFSQIWNFPGGKEKGYPEGFGFKADQVVADGQAGCMHTADPDGPNLWLYQSAGVAMKYESFFGQKKPYRGWFHPGFGPVTPAPQVMVDWQSDRECVVLTVLYPTPDNAPPACRWQPTAKPDGRSAGFVLGLPDGSELNCAAATQVQSLQAGSFERPAQLLVTWQAPDHTRHSLVLGSPQNPASGVEEQTREGRQTVTGRVQISSGFYWNRTVEGLVPMYSPPAASGKAE